MHPSHNDGVPVIEREPEPSLVERARSGETEALGDLYALHARTVHRVAFRLTGSVQEADDVLQEVFLGLPEALARFRGRGPLDAWLRQVTARRAMMFLRSQRRQREYRAEAQRWLPRVAAPEPIVDRLALARALDELEPAVKAVFVLKEMEGFSHDEISETLGITVHASAQRLYRARSHLRDLLKEED